ncbi:hypothetical protein [Ferrimicrobium sp.]|uniref:hypothetical protein n=1 Tax=Ferrimicrobium sp. TaxID=2926050 RepID=UPI0026237550|nr:hypothetical protein [Ferrimicrobium sp.]
MSVWVTFGASVVGGTVAAAAALGGVAIGQRGENTRANRQDQQRLRDAKADRLRHLYEPLVKFAMALRQVALEKSYVLEGDTVEDRDERHRQALSLGMEKMSAVAAAMIIEPETSAVREAYMKTYQACDQYFRSLNTNTAIPGTVQMTTLKEEFKAIRDAADELEAVILRQMEELEKPV